MGVREKIKNKKINGRNEEKGMTRRIMRSREFSK